MRSRNDAVAELYAAKATELYHAVRVAVHLPDDLVEDACSYAWCQLLTCERVAAEDASFGWLYVVAIRQGYRLSGRLRREPSAGMPNELPQQALATSDSWGVVERHLELEARRALLAQLPERKRRLVLLHAAGFTYKEIAAMTGDTLLTIERQLLRGKRALRQLQQTNS
jgi:RNA polymerase sigma factor (sigma-70 family)